MASSLARLGAALPRARPRAAARALPPGRWDAAALGASRRAALNARRCQVHSEVKAAPTSDLKDGENSSKNWRIKMLYDGDCPLCMREGLEFGIGNRSHQFSCLDVHRIMLWKLRSNTEAFSPVATYRFGRFRAPALRIRLNSVRAPPPHEAFPSPPARSSLVASVSTARQQRRRGGGDGATLVGDLARADVNMLRERNKSYGAINFVDISSKDYSPEDNQGLDYETAMGRIHAILSDGTVVTDVEAFRKLYEEVGLGWVYAVTKYEPVATMANAVYGVWAKYRMQITGRPPLEEIMASRKAAGECKDDKVCKM
ncbi:hypothetical protein ACP70R_010516 [Stipagrostis hirtigluma subsp. patula]